MKQRIEARLIVASSRHKLNIKSVHEVDGKLIVITEHEHRGGWGYDDYCTITDKCIVNTSGKKELPVVHYLTGNTKEEIAAGEDAATQSMNCPYGSDPTTFTPITNESDIADLLAKGKQIFAPRKDKLHAVRLGHIERAAGKYQQASQANDDHAASFTLSAEQLQDTLNIYPIVDDGSFKVVLEEIKQKNKDKSEDKEKNKPLMNLRDLISEGLKLSNSHIDLDEDCFMTSDDIINIDAIVDGKEMQYNTHAVEFTLPTNDGGAILNFLRFLDGVIKTANKPGNDYYKPYPHIQIGQHSVLSSFDDLLLTEEKGAFSDKGLKVISPQSVNLQDFFQQAGTIHQPESAFDALVGAFMQAKVSGYEDMQSFVSEIREMGHGAVWFPHVVLGKLLGVDLTELRGDAPIETKLEKVAQMEKALSDEHMLNKTASLLKAIIHNGVSDFLMKVLNVTAYDGGKYNPSYTEFQVLFHADFNLHEDGKIGIKVANNPGYLKWYAPGRKNHDILEAEMRHLIHALGLDFAAGCDFHQEIVFDEASSLKLKALGMHLNETYLRQKLINQPVQEQAVEQTLVVSSEPVVVPQTIDELLNSKVVTALRAKFPESNAILQVMRDSGLFTDNASDNRSLVAGVMHACDFFTPAARAAEKKAREGVVVLSMGGDSKDDEEENISALVNLYKILAPRDGQAVLTQKLHQEIIQNTVRAHRLQQVANTLQILGNLDVKQTQAFILNSAYYLNIKSMLADFDETDESFIYLFQHTPSHDFMSSFWDTTLACQRMFGGLTYLRVQDFKLIVDNIATKNWYNILSGLGYLERAGLLESHRDRFLQLADFKLSLHDLKMKDMLNAEMVDLALDHREINTEKLIGLGYLQKAGLLPSHQDKVLQHTAFDLPLEKLSHDEMMTAENLDLAFSNPDYEQAEKECNSFRLTGYHSKFQNDKEGEKAFRKNILANPELCQAILTFSKVMDQVRERTNLRSYFVHEEYAKYLPDMQALLNAAKMVKPNKKDNALIDCLTKGMTMFAPKQETLEECLQRIKDKYSYQEPVVEVQQVAKAGM